jgi:uncharacterized membrane protein YheB (UPF0754 family)
VLRAKIKKELEQEGQKGKIYRLQKKIVSQKRQLDQSLFYKIQRDAMKAKIKKYKKAIEEANGLINKYRLQRNAFHH